MDHDEPRKGGHPRFFSETEVKREEIHRRGISRVTQWDECSVMEQSFFEAQGYMVEHNMLYQDSKSTILMENNVIASRSKRKKHRKEKYVFKKYHIDQGGVQVE